MNTGSSVGRSHGRLSRPPSRQRATGGVKMAVVALIPTGVMELAPSVTPWPRFSRITPLLDIRRNGMWMASRRVTSLSLTRHRLVPFRPTSTNSPRR